MNEQVQAVMKRRWQRSQLLDIEYQVIADAFFAEHLADDHEPITASFLAIEGWTVHGGILQRWINRIRLSFISNTIYIGSTDASVHVENIKTRGDLRLLCRALGGAR